MIISRRQDKITYRPENENYDVVIYDTLSDCKTSEILEILEKISEYNLNRIFKLKIQFFSLEFLNILFDYLHEKLWLVSQIEISSRYETSVIHWGIFPEIKIWMNIIIEPFLFHTKFKVFEMKITQNLYSRGEFDLSPLFSKNLVRIRIIDPTTPFCDQWIPLIENCPNLKRFENNFAGREPSQNFFDCIEKSKLENFGIGIFGGKIFKAIERNKSIKKLKIFYGKPEMGFLDMLMNNDILEEITIAKAWNDPLLILGLKENTGIRRINLNDFRGKLSEEMIKMFSEKDFIEIKVESYDNRIKFSSENLRQMIKEKTVERFCEKNQTDFFRKFYRKNNLKVLCPRAEVDQFDNFYFACVLAKNLQRYRGGVGYLFIERILDFLGIDEKVEGHWRTQMLMYSVELGMDLSNRSEFLSGHDDYLSRMELRWQDI